MTANARITLEEPLVFERWWLPPIYTCSAAFVLDGAELSSAKVTQDLQPLYEAARAHRKRRWPCVLTQFFLVPVYCASSFSSETVTWLGMRRSGLGRFGIRLNPVLYNTQTNVVECKEALQNHNLNYYAFLKPLYAQGVRKAAEHFGNDPRQTRDKYDELIAAIRKPKIG